MGGKSTPPESWPRGHPEHWLIFARSDLALAKIRLPDGALYESLCYHAHQAVEKSLKAVLVARGISFPRTHHIRTLIELLPADLPRPPILDDSAALSDYAVTSRYPTTVEPVGKEESEEATRLADTIMVWAERTVRTICAKE